jgi:hypothetical protein
MPQGSLWLLSGGGPCRARGKRVLRRPPAPARVPLPVQPGRYQGAHTGRAPCRRGLPNAGAKTRALREFVAHPRAPGTGQPNVRPARVSTIRQQLEQREQGVAEREQAARAHELAVEERERAVGVREGFVSALEDYLGTRETFVGEREREVSERERSVGILEQELAKRERAVRKRERRMDEQAEETQERFEHQHFEQAAHAADEETETGTDEELLLVFGPGQERELYDSLRNHEFEDDTEEKPAPDRAQQQ